MAASVKALVQQYTATSTGKTTNNKTKKKKHEKPAPIKRD
jgi:hypothetical protein